MPLDFLSKFQVCVFCNDTRRTTYSSAGTGISDLEAYNDYCRQNNIGFILCECYGLASSVFVDYGDSFVTRDKTGEEVKTAIVSGIVE